MKTNKERGVEMLKGISDSLFNLAQGTAAWASNQYLKYKVGKDKNGMNVIEPDNYYELPDLKNVGLKIGEVITALIAPLAELGDKNVGTFGGLKKGNIEVGVNILSSLSGSLEVLAKGVGAWASGKYLKYHVQKNKETGLNELTPLDFFELPKVSDAKKHLTNIIDSLIGPISEISSKYDEDDLEDSIKILVGVGNSMENLGKFGTSIYEIDGIKFTNNTNALVKGLWSIIYVFDPRVNKGIIMSSTYLEKFVKNFKDLVSPMEALAKSIDKVVKPMSELNKIFDNKNEGVIKSFDNWTKSIIELSNVDKSKFNNNWNLINKTFENGVKNTKSKKEPKTTIENRYNNNESKTQKQKNNINNNIETKKMKQ